MNNLVERLINEWHESDHTIPLHEHLRLTPSQYQDYVEGRLTDCEVEAIYLARPSRQWDWLPVEGQHDYEE